MAAEGPQMKLARESAEKRSNSSIEVIEGWPFADGKPLVKISCAAAELIPTRQYGNCTVGPIQVTTFATADGEVFFEPAGLQKAIRAVQEACEVAVADDRQTVQALTRANAGS